MCPHARAAQSEPRSLWCATTTHCRIALLTPWLPHPHRPAAAAAVRPALAARVRVRAASLQLDAAQLSHYVSSSLLPAKQGGATPQSSPLSASSLSSSHSSLLHFLSSSGVRRQLQLRPSVSLLADAARTGLVIVQHCKDSDAKVVRNITAFGEEWVPIDAIKLRASSVVSNVASSADSGGSAPASLDDDEKNEAGAGAASSSSSAATNEDTLDIHQLNSSLPCISENEILFVSLRSAQLIHPSAALLSYEQREKQLPAALAASKRAFKEARENIAADTEVAAIGVFALEKFKLKQELAAHRLQPSPQPQLISVHDSMTLPLGTVELDGNLFFINRIPATSPIDRKVTRPQTQLCCVGSSACARQAERWESQLGSCILQDKHCSDLTELFDGKLPKLTLLYSGKRDGCTAADFHRLCDNKGATLTVVRAMTDGKRYVFGGYNSASWSSPAGDGKHSGEPCWVYSLESPTGLLTKYAFTDDGEQGTYSSSIHGPCWGICLTISGDMTTGDNCSRCDGDFSVVAGFSGMSFGHTTLAGGLYFAIDEIEVFACSGTS